MEQYKEKLKLSQRITAVAALILAIFAVIAIAAQNGLLNIAPVTGDSRWQSMWRGFVCGAGSGISILMLINLIRTSKALRSEKELKKLYVKENDERQIQIWTSARASATQAFLILGLVAGVVAGYFNMTVSITILGCVVIHSLIGMGFKLYYSRKF